MGASLVISFTFLVIINDLYVLRAHLGPDKADAPLVVDPNAVLTLSVAAERLQPIAGRDAKIRESDRGIEEHELPQRRPKNPRVEGPHLLSSPQPLSLSVSEGPDHRPSITRYVNNVMR